MVILTSSLNRKADQVISQYWIGVSITSNGVGRIFCGTARRIFVLIHSTCVEIKMVGIGARVIVRIRRSINHYPTRHAHNIAYTNISPRVVRVLLPLWNRSALPELVFTLFD